MKLVGGHLLLYGPDTCVTLLLFTAAYVIILIFSYGIGAVMPRPPLKLYIIHCTNQCSEVLSNTRKWTEVSLKILLLEAHPRNLAAVLVVGVLKSQVDNILRPVLKRKEANQDLQGRNTWLLMTKMLKKEKTMTTKLIC